jgi:hypothetical protein
MDTPYDLKVLSVGEPELPAGVVFHDDFSDGPSLRWTNLNSVSVRDGVLRFGNNESPWRGPARLEMWQGLESASQDATLEMAFRLSGVPEHPADVLTLLTRAETPAWSEHGISHTRLGRGSQALSLRAGPKGEPWELVRVCRNHRGHQQGVNVHHEFGAVDTKWHTLTVVIEGVKTTVRFDGEELAVYDDTPDYGMAFGLHGAKDLSDDCGLEIDHVTLRHTSEDCD